MTTLTTQSQPWVLTQLRPPGKVLKLEGASAPHGRRRRQAIVDNEFELRLTETFLPGVRLPTWTVWGDKESPLVVRGRFMDRELGPSGARAKLYETKNLIADGVECLLRWGSVLSYLVMPTKLRHAREDATEIAYEITMFVGQDNDLVRKLAIPDPPRSPVEIVAEVEARIVDLQSKIDLLGELAGYAQDFQDILADAVSRVNSASATLLHAADAVQDFESATIGDVQRLLGGAGQFRTALLTLTGVLDSIEVEGALLNRQANHVVSWMENVAEADLSQLEILQLLADLELDGSRRLLGSSRVELKTIVARGGDTWESIASRELGSPDSASAVRAANGIRYGEKPQPGRSYLIPST